MSTLLALTLYIPLVWQILSRKVTQNLATFILWGTLDAVAAMSLFTQHGNWYLPAAYVGGCLLVIGSLIYVRTMKWTWFETLISVMVIVCIIGWWQSGPRMATILSTAGVVIAGLPQLWDSYTEPETQPFVIYWGFVLVNVLSTLGGKSWIVEERLYPASCAVLCFLVVLAISRKFIHKPTISPIV